MIHTRFPNRGAGILFVVRALAEYPGRMPRMDIENKRLEITNFLLDIPYILCYNDLAFRALFF